MQTCYICFEVATANDISGVEDIANEILCDLRFSFPCLSRVTAELSGCDRKRFNSAALYKKEQDPVIRGGRAGRHCRDCGGKQSAAV